MQLFCICIEQKQRLQSNAEVSTGCDICGTTPQKICAIHAHNNLHSCSHARLLYEGIKYYAQNCAGRLL